MTELTFIAFTAGLDVQTRALVLSLLQTLHEENKPHIVLGMRPQDPIPDWTTHLALIQGDGTVHTGAKQDVLETAAGNMLHSGWKPPVAGHAEKAKHQGEALISLSGISVSYGERKV